MKVFFWIYNVFLLLVISVIFQNFSITAVGMVGILILYFCCRDLENVKYKDLIAVITIAILFMLLLYVGLIEKFGEPYYASDDIRYEYYGNLLFQKNIFKFKDIPYIEGMFYAKGYLIIIAWIQKIGSFFGEYSTISPRVLNLYLWISVAVLMSKKMSDSVADKKIVRKTFALLALFPNALYIASFVYRDVFIIFLIVVSIYNFEKLTEGFKKGIFNGITFVRIPIVLFCLYGLYYSRQQMLYVVAIIFLLSLFQEKLKPQRSSRVILIVAATIAGVILLQFTGGIELLSEMNEGYSSYLSDQAGGLSGIIFSKSLLPFGIFLRFAYGFVTPFPAALLSLNYFDEPIYSLVIASTCFGTIFQIFLLPYLYKGVKRMDYPAIKFLGMYGPIILTTFTFRHFIMVYPFAACILAQQIEITGYRTRKKYAVYVLLLIGIAAAFYVLLKLF
ncbi:MAG: hypothetical protein HFI74_00475 [Lachnospiraceae bacterium]|jgi:hypothetical protein|nr:hypothetical protein [Lachnospiraceae bacterium]